MWFPEFVSANRPSVSSRAIRLLRRAIKAFSIVTPCLELTLPLFALVVRLVIWGLLTLSFTTSDWRRLTGETCTLLVCLTRGFSVASSTSFMKSTLSPSLSSYLGLFLVVLRIGRPLWSISPSCSVSSSSKLSSLADPLALTSSSSSSL